jgi:hypothetical protein
MNNKSGGEHTLGGLFALSRPVKPGETIDFFMSHSWHDDPTTKFDTLKRVVSKFQAKYGRPPTFWLDKVCIDQKNISDGLKVLPINVMSCQKMLVLCGKTYPKRLWCAWELCTLFSFMRQEQALERVEVEPLNKQGSKEEGMLEQLVHFDVSVAHCYDPNEEMRLRRVIGAVGESQFNDRIRVLAKACIKQAQEQKEREAQERLTSFGTLPILHAHDLQVGAAKGARAAQSLARRASHIVGGANSTLLKLSSHGSRSSRLGLGEEEPSPSGSNRSGKQFRSMLSVVRGESGVDDDEGDAVTDGE